ncbi:MAG: hypothetical protein RLZZ612_1614 [Pseudomonadota bacterium]|jgi:hypothetical protein
MLRPFLSRYSVPVHQNLLVDTSNAARAVTRGDLNFVICENCGFIFNQAFDFSRLSYHKNYDNTQSHSPVFTAYMDEIVDNMIYHKNIKNCNIIEIGCGKGDFIRKLISHPASRNVGYGFDPSYIGPLHDINQRLNFRNCFYDEKCTDIVPDVVVCRHVIEHIAQPLTILKSVRSALAGSKNAKVFFETPCVEWILKHRVIWDFFYEHCSLFSAKSLRFAFERSGFIVDNIEHIFNGQYLWLEATLADDVDFQTETPTDLIAMSLSYSSQEKNIQDVWYRRLYDLRQFGKIALWGAGAKGVTLANLIDPHCILIDCVVDLNPKKQGCFIPGTGHPIISPLALSERQISNAVIMNPNYLEENQNLINQENIKVNLIC